MSLDEKAGVNCEKDHKFRTLPENLRDPATKHFSYIGISKGREFAGPTSSIFYKRFVSAQQEADSNKAFESSLPEVIDILKKLDPTPINIRTNLKEPALELLQRFWPKAATMTVDLNNQAQRLLLRGVMELVSQASLSAESKRNAAALLDPFNNVLLIMPSGPIPSINNPLELPQPSPLQSALMNLTRAYAECRRLGGKAMNGNLPHPKRCKWVLLHGPGKEATDIMDLGAFGSTLEEKPHDSVEDKSLCYFVERQSERELETMIRSFPPLYKDTIFKKRPFHLKTFAA
ncbi:hypothetical protein H2198_002248 [Neophaeococcomyces mojaviensis]|uniref:Uncharacterized protein n=1 Tax=Neophaeococcomyces mojaviensis TaxID=3383035 RepID=A0ACC3AF28_9EURO|nr:hypothetical protein H2198_002248 [Knufia sp. JES_112]